MINQGLTKGKLFETKMSKKKKSPNVKQLNSFWVQLKEQDFSLCKLPSSKRITNKKGTLQG